MYCMKNEPKPQQTGVLVLAIRFNEEEQRQLRELATQEDLPMSTVIKRLIRRATGVTINSQKPIEEVIQQ